MSSDSPKSNRSLLAVCLLVVIAIVGYFVFRPASDTNSKGTPEEYVTAMAPVVKNARKIADQIESTSNGSEVFGAVPELESGWADVRTGPGYDGQTHDDFIIVFGSFVTQLKSAGLLWERLQARESGSSEDRTELVFILQSLHGAESSAQLLSKRELSLDALLSSTNLNFEVTNSLAQAPAVLENAIKLYNNLPTGVSE